MELKLYEWVEYRNGTRRRKDPSIFKADSDEDAIRRTTGLGEGKLSCIGEYVRYPEPQLIYEVTIR